MFRNYLKIAFRNLWKHKVYSAINILGLTVGLSAGFLIFLYVRFEMSYDNFHQKAPRIYRLVTDIKTPSETINTGVTSWAFGPNLKMDMPEIEAYVRLNGESILLRNGDRKFQEDALVFADSSLFQVFDFPLLKGNPATALRDPFSIVLTQKAARKYFGDEDPLGKSLSFGSRADAAKVTGVMRDIPENSLIKGEVFASMSTFSQKMNPGIDDQWGNFGATTFLLLKPGTSSQALTARFPAFVEKRYGEGMKQAQMHYTFLLEPLRDVYLKSDRLSGGEGGSMSNVYIFSIIALFIVLIACINFVNLTTARASERAREVGIRKVAGALKTQLMKQFLGESLVIAILSFALSLALISALLPLFNLLAGKTISHNIFLQPRSLFLLLAAATGIGLLAGIYPALVLSAFKPMVVLKGRFSSSTRGILLRKGLVVAQFSISIALIIGTITVYRQMQFMRNRKLGFTKDQMLVIDTHGDAARDALKQAIAGLPGVISTAMSSSVPGGGNPGAYSQLENSKGDMQVANMDLYFVDFDYIKQYGIQIVAGRPFSRDFMTDTTHSMLINETAARLLGYSKAADAVGKRFQQWGREGQIIGVMKDFHFRSLQETIKPLTMRIEPDGCSLVSAHVAAANVPATLAAIQQQWQKLIPSRPFSYYFLDEFFDRQYRAEERFGKLFLNFAILAIFISCLGLLGLASYSTMQRTKEIGIRKVLGAGVPGIVKLLSKDFLALVLLSFVLAGPVAWYFMHQWLKDFAYRTNLSWWVFGASVALALLIAFVTVSFQAIKAAVANPVRSLRSE